MTQAFDPIAGSYGQWYDAPEGRTIFSAELACFRMLCVPSGGRWLEVGVGTGRFASSLGIVEGVDPSPRMLEIAAGRGIRTYTGTAESLPFADDTFDGVLLALTLCFVADSKRAAMECRRVLRAQGRLLVGHIAADSSWGRHYEEKKAAGHPVYSHARFLATAQVVSLMENAGFRLQSAASTLFGAPGDKGVRNLFPQGGPEEAAYKRVLTPFTPRVETSIVPGPGFVGLLFT